ncbi:hypothetical protein R3P38DRAFT_3123704 [Favolaschia claudopus]|uniref:F-box domain-containing protein n=1 Tax=Favolaschia claudopus TaxID=2862362 RepID=A0AAV9ZBM9_9AGAR
MNPSENAQMSPESPFQSHLYTNYIPTDPEISQIRAHLVPHEAELVHLDALIQDLCAQRVRVKAYLDSYKALISHPRRLPQDILEEIFLACLPTAHDAVMSLAEPPLLLGRICSRWRAIAFALPRLWSSLHIHVDYVKWNEERIAAIDEWLKRTSSSPLSISVRGNNDLGFSDDLAVVNILTGHSSHWSTLRLYKLTNEAFLSLAAESAPALSDIEIHLQDHFDEDTERPFLASRFLLGQKQGRISVATADLPSFVPTTPFTWAHITDLSLERADSFSYYGDGTCDMATAYRLFEGCPRLTALKLHIPARLAEPLIDSPLTVSSLESLNIETHAATSLLLTIFFKHFIMPQLTKFHLVDRSPPPSSLLEPAIVKQFADHTPSISDFDLELFNVSATVSILLGLRYFPKVTKLSMVVRTPDKHTDYADNDEDLLFAILAPNSSINPVPALEDLSLEAEFVVEETWMEFLREHINHRTSLRRLHLKLWVDSPDDIPTHEFAEFLDAGLDVSVDYEVDETESYQATPWGGIDHEEYTSRQLY